MLETCPLFERSCDHWVDLDVQLSYKFQPCVLQFSCHTWDLHEVDATKPIDQERDFFWIPSHKGRDRELYTQPFKIRVHVHPQTWQAHVFVETKTWAQVYHPLTGLLELDPTRNFKWADGTTLIQLCDLQEQVQEFFERAMFTISPRDVESFVELCLKGDPNAWPDFQTGLENFNLCLHTKFEPHLRSHFQNPSLRIERAVDFVDLSTLHVHPASLDDLPERHVRRLCKLNWRVDLAPLIEPPDKTVIPKADLLSLRLPSPHGNLWTLRTGRYVRHHQGALEFEIMCYDRVPCFVPWNLIEAWFQTFASEDLFNCGIEFCNSGRSKSPSKRSYFNVRQVFAQLKFVQLQRSCNFIRSVRLDEKAQRARLSEAEYSKRWWAQQAIGRLSHLVHLQRLIKKFESVLSALNHLEVNVFLDEAYIELDPCSDADDASDAIVDEDQQLARAFSVSFE